MKRDGGRLDLIANVFAKRELEVARKLSEFQTQLTHAKAQLRELRAHRDRHAATPRDGFATDPSRLQNQQAFLSQLNATISQQIVVIRRAENDRDDLRERWLAQRQKTKSVEKVCAKRRAAALRKQAAQEQSQQDELTRALPGKNAPS